MDRNLRYKSENISLIIDELISEIENLERENDKKDVEIEELKDKIKELEQQ